MQILIPAAGMGKRLGSETVDKTKAMVKVAGKTLIERCLDSVVMHSIERIILVVGYEKDKLKRFLGASYKGVEIVYVENDKYSTTNNIYSVFLARDYLLQDDTILIESDLIFEPKLLEMVIKNDSENLALVDKYKPWMDGTVVKISDDFSISHFIPKSDFDYDYVDQYYKTVNIYKFSQAFMTETYVPFLEAYARSRGNNEYYEQVLKVIVNLDCSLIKALPLDGELWYEIDDIQDLDNASLIFSSPEIRHNLLSKRYGGYWRYDEVIDFCYLVNPFFPPKTLTNELKFSFNNLIKSYPSSERVQAMLGAKMFGVPQKNIIVGNGAAELIYLLGNVLSGRFGLYGPTFEEYTARFDNVDFRILDTDGFRYGKSDILHLAKDNDGVILVNPDNPSGNFICYGEIIEILEVLKSSNKYLILDESFVDFAHAGFESSLLNPEDLAAYPNLIVIKSIGKSYGIGGLRLGVMATSNQHIMDSMKKKLPIWNINSVAEFYLQIIGKYESDYRRSCEALLSCRNELFSELEKIDYLHPYESQANYILCKVLQGRSAKIALELSEKYSILIKDCSEKMGIDGQYIRLAVRNSVDNEYLLNSLCNIHPD